MTHGDSFFFFGSRQVPREDLPRLFPAYRFAFLKQVHGARVLAGTHEHNNEADGHYTRERGLALVVQSADCMPILMASATTVVALHAGWRGLAQNIVAAAHATLTGFQPELVALGPHIGAQSFAIKQDVAMELTAAAPRDAPQFWHAQSGGEILFNLQALATAQVHAVFSDCALTARSEDTKRDEQFYSYRRDGSRAGRQFSFVVLNP